MRITTLVSVVALAVMVGPVSASAQSATSDGVSAVPTATVELESASAQFDTLNGIPAVPMASGELDAVKGLHVHFLDANGGFHLAGNPGNNGIGDGNWYLNGSPDGEPVAPSYHGLCVAPPIIIPFNPMNGSQCP